jgi:N6-L-threonylcarbamoyladenine synthase
VSTEWQRQQHDILASFQQAVVDMLVTKTIRAAVDLQAKAITMVGGVACNTALRSAMQHTATSLQLPVFFPSPRFCTDNAAMIACAAFYRYHANQQYYYQQDFLDLDAMANMALSTVEADVP